MIQSLSVAVASSTTNGPYDGVLGETGTAPNGRAPVAKSFRPELSVNTVFAVGAAACLPRQLSG